MADIANQVLSVKYILATSSVVPCVGTSKGIDTQGRMNASFSYPISLSYYSNNQIVTVNATPTAAQTSLVGTVDAMQVRVEYSIANAPVPDNGSQATCVVKIVTVDQNNQP